jgi:hypothetical protein
LRPKAHCSAPKVTSSPSLVLRRSAPALLLFIVTPPLVKSVKKRILVARVFQLEIWWDSCRRIFNSRRELSIKLRNYSIKLMNSSKRAKFLLLEKFPLLVYLQKLERY